MGECLSELNLIPVYERVQLKAAWSRLWQWAVDTLRDTVHQAYDDLLQQQPAGNRVPSNANDINSKEYSSTGQDSAAPDRQNTTPCCSEDSSHINSPIDNLDCVPIPGVNSINLPSQATSITRKASTEAYFEKCVVPVSSVPKGDDSSYAGALLSSASISLRNGASEENVLTTPSSTITKQVSEHFDEASTTDDCAGYRNQSSEGELDTSYGLGGHLHSQHSVYHSASQSSHPLHGAEFLATMSEVEYIRSSVGTTTGDILLNTITSTSGPCGEEGHEGDRADDAARRESGGPEDCVVIGQEFSSGGPGSERNSSLTVGHVRDPFTSLPSSR